ncbi:glycosyltransferase family 76 protein [Xylona heveae TC161]|uniref:GPI mannosyltransferase 2 n=1 Tax=Xylona heveae (strain CBS 132557 / TC161) TaxID=1328760 RepID=A0A165IJ24_XYLHT|nr:glycosyltransferase family 76 protein [Xylona heveae TC161]KZF24963.1 glycosyltransferase family 76 protein [Xylona heveae TC161]
MALRSSSTLRPLDRPLTALCLCFVSWKIILFIIACLAPGPGYDTSTALLLGRLGQLSGNVNTSPENATQNNILMRLMTHVASKLVRWDAIYFTQIAERGYAFEQEWAFGWGFTQLISQLTQTLASLGLITTPPTVTAEAIVGIFLAHSSHFFSVIILHHLASLLLPIQSRAPLAFIIAFLHIVTPAGLFLSGPCTESVFSFFSFSGLYLFVLSHVYDLRARRGPRDLCTLFSGIFFGLASTVRSNGLLNGILYLYDLVALLQDVLTNRNLTVAHIRRGLILALSGLFVAAGIVYPQYLAYQSFCTLGESQADLRPWCQERLPSIYAYVQSAYWDVGFLRYWTVSNLPLFLLAAPMLYILSSSAIWALMMQRPKSKDDSAKASHAERSLILTSPIFARCITPLAIIQLLLAILAFTNYHVQIISRISSGYVVWYIWVALKLSGELAPASGDKLVPTESIVRWMVVYAIIQGGLFASFLPPA